MDITKFKILQFIEKLCRQPVVEIFENVEVPVRPSVLLNPLAENRYLRMWVEPVENYGEFVNQLPSDLEQVFERCLAFMVEAVLFVYLDVVGGSAKENHWIRNVHLELDNETLSFVPVYKSMELRQIELKHYHIEMLKNTLAHPDNHTAAELDDLENSLEDEKEQLASLQQAYTEDIKQREEEENCKLRTGVRLAISCDIKELSPGELAEALRPAEQPGHQLNNESEI